MPNFNLFHFSELKKLLNDNKNGIIALNKDDEIKIRIAMRNKLLTKKDSNISISNPESLSDSRYKKEIKKDQLNNSLTDRLNSEIDLVNVTKKISPKILIESPYDSAKPLDKNVVIPLGIDLERGFKKVTCYNNKKKVIRT